MMAPGGAESLVLASAVLDCVAVAVIAWFVRRAGRERDAALGMQRGTLDRLRAEMLELVRAAEERGQALAAALDAREERLQALLGGEAPFGAGGPARPASLPRLGIDPAEARLRRDLERSVQGASSRPSGS